MLINFCYREVKYIGLYILNFLCDGLSIKSFEVHHPCCVGSITKNFLCITHTVEHNYISSSSTLGLQLHVSALYVDHLQVVT